VCTIIVLNQVSAHWPVVLASNRDELFARPAGPPRLWPGQPRVIAPVDQLKGGTWMGVSEGGFFAAVTNQRTWGGNADERLSRGDLVMSLLRAGNHGRAREFLAGVDARQYNPFNLLFGDATSLALGYGRSHRAEVQIADVPKGVHVLANDELDSPSVPKVETIRRRLEGADQLGPERLPTPITSTARPPTHRSASSWLIDSAPWPSRPSSTGPGRQLSWRWSRELAPDSGTPMAPPSAPR
jgi:uncharacterized protein with NRDE domain